MYWSDELKSAVARLYKLGYSKGYIAIQFSLTPDQVSSQMRRMGIKRPQTMKVPKHSFAAEETERHPVLTDRGDAARVHSDPAALIEPPQKPDHVEGRRFSKAWYISQNFNFLLNMVALGFANQIEGYLDEFEERAKNDFTRRRRL